MKNLYIAIRAAVISALLCLSGFSALAQYPITGPTSVIVGNTYTYSCTRASGAWPSAGGTVWSAVGGTVLSMSIDPADKRITTVTVRWDKAQIPDDYYDLSVSDGTVSGGAKITVGCGSIAGPTFSVSPSQVACQETSFTISVTGSNGTTIDWYNNAGDTAPFHTGTGYTTPTLNGDKTYYIASYNATTNCYSNKVSIPLSFPTPPPVPTAPTFSFENYICGSSGSAQITAVPTGGGDQVRWYTSSSGGTPVYTGQVFNTPVLSSPTTYYIASYNSAACGVESQVRVPVVVNIYPIPSIPNVSGQSVCGPTDITLSATPGVNGNTVYWTGANGNTLGSGNTKPVGIVSATSTFYARTVNIVNIVDGLGCLSAKVPVTITVNPLNNAPASASYTFHEGDVMKITTSGYSTGGTLNWYNSNDELLYTGISYTVNQLYGNYTYHVKTLGVGGICESTAYGIVTVNVDQNYNWIKETTVLVKGKKTDDDINSLGVSTGEKSVDWNYFDDLGRPSQTVKVQSSPQTKDIVQPVTYDVFGREDTKYLPYTSSQSAGNFKANALAEQTGFYQAGGTIASDNTPYAKISFETSPLGRSVVEGSPGEAWQPNDQSNYTSEDHTVKKFYTINDANEVWLWSYNTSGSVTPFDVNTPGTLVYYPAGQLTKVKTKDEQGNEVIEYTDKSGHLILKRVQVVANATTVDDVNYASTYYVYDDFGHLVTVLPPEAIKELLNK